MKQTHDLVQGTDPWDLFRLEHFGASEAAAMLGLSKKTTRNELLRMKKTGIAKTFSEWLQVNVLDHGHEVEALARPHIEKLIGEELYPVTCSDGKESASCDGLTMDDRIAMEHKQWNESLAAIVAAGQVPDEHMPQCQQVLKVTGAEKLIFVVADGTPEKMVFVWVFPDPVWFERLSAGWAQFEQDLITYEATEPVVEAVGRTPETLPALRIEVTGAVTASNLAQYRDHALAVFAGINRDLKTDQDFANADKTVKWCGEVESRLAAAKQHALSQTESIDVLFKTIDDITAEARSTRLELDKLVKARKEARRGEIVAGGIRALVDHVAALNARIGKPYMPSTTADFGTAIKGLRTFDSMQNAVDTALANAKITASATADRIQTNLGTLRELAAGLPQLFPDTAQIVLKAPEDLTSLVKTRVAEHQAAEAKKEEELRESIRKEEVARAERIQREAQEAEDALITSIWTNARRIEFDSVPYIQKAIASFESGAGQFEADARPRVAAAVASARGEMTAKLEAAKAREQAATATPPGAAPIAASAAVATPSATPISAPAAVPAPTVIPMPTRTAAPTSAPSLRLGVLNTRLAPVQITADGLATLGFVGVKDRGAVLFHESDYPHILAALAAHVQAIQAKQAA